MHDDDPDDVVHNLFADAGLGRVAARSADRRHRRLDRVDEPRPDPSLLPAALPARAWWSPSPATSTTPSRRPAGALGVRPPRLPRPAPPTRWRPGRRRAHARRPPASSQATRPFEQVNVVLGVQGITRTDPRRFALGVLNTALGGGTSSRLFQEVREKRGLAYSVFSFASHHADAGLVGVSVGCLPNKLDEVLAVVRAELAKVAARRHHRRGADPRQGPAAGRAGARARGLRLADVAARQGRAGRRRAARHRRGDRPDRRGHPRGRARRSPPSCSRSRRSWPSSVLARERRPSDPAWPSRGEGVNDPRDRSSAPQDLLPPGQADDPMVGLARPPRPEPQDDFVPVGTAGGPSALTAPAPPRRRRRPPRARW